MPVNDETVEIILAFKLIQQEGVATRRVHQCCPPGGGGKGGRVDSPGSASGWFGGLRADSDSLV